MTGRLIADAGEWVDGFSRLVMTRDIDGRIHISVHDERRPGFTFTVKDSDKRAEIAAFIEGDE